MVHPDADEAHGASRGGTPSTRHDAPHPHPSWGAGGPRQRAAGRVLAGGGVPLRRPRVLAHGSETASHARPRAVLLEPDALLRPAVAEAVHRLGFEPGLAAARVVFANLAGLGLCPSAPESADVLVVGYVVGRPLTGAAHVLHECCAQVLELRMLRDGPAFTTLLVPPGLETERPTPREADVLALLLAGATDRGMAAALGVAPSTVRTHVRAVLRKTGAADRRALRRLDGQVTAEAVGPWPAPLRASSPAHPSGLLGSGVQVRPDSAHGPRGAARG